MEIINLNVIENDGFTKLDVDQPESTEMEMEQVEIIHAVSPTVDLERMTNGVKIKVNDYRGSSSEIVYDGPKGEPGEVTQAEFDELSESVDDLVKDVSDLNSALNEDRLLFVSEIEDTVQALTRDANGNVNGMTHSRSGSTIRTDIYVKANGVFTETRTLANGKYITLVTDLSTKVTTISDIQEAA